tara:strand:+ start:186 stop:539 length:354 start_codon:yes stop_codon:yes gene_type:complete
MPYKDKEKQREYNKQYQKEWREANKEYHKEYQKEYKKEYNQTEAGRKSRIICHWKSRGIYSENYNSLYEYYLNVENCEECDVELVEGIVSNGRCLDHDHKTGLFRNVLCRSCNIKRK